MTNFEQNIQDENKSKPSMHKRIWNEDLEFVGFDIIPNLLHGVSARGLRNTEKFAERRRDSQRPGEAVNRRLSSGGSGAGSSGGGDVSLGGFHQSATAVPENPSCHGWILPASVIGKTLERETESGLTSVTVCVCERENTDSGGKA